MGMRHGTQDSKAYRKPARKRAVVLASALVLGLAAAGSMPPGAGLVGTAWAGRGVGAVPDRLDRKAEAFRNWLPNALRGDAHAQYQLGAAYLTGRSEHEDFAEAARWLKMSAQQGNPRAQSGLGILYSKGLGVRRNFTEAYVWFDLAAEQFEHGLRREQAVELREMVRGFMSPDQLTEAEGTIEARKAGWE
jgi:TPR repeat protein